MNRSPLNYVGGKFKVLNQLLPILPQNIETLVELFGGGINLSLNTPASRFWVNDTCSATIGLYSYLRKNSEEEVLGQIEATISKYEISLTNKEGYLQLRRDYNNRPNPIQFFVLVSNSFNHQIRFNSQGKFNMPFGRERSFFNPKMRKNLLSLINFLKTHDVMLTCLDFRDCIVEPTCFLYCDPPYNLSTAVYNSGWNEKDDFDLVNFLDAFHDRGGHFALSCLLSHHGIENTVFKEWSKKYVIHPITWKHGNANYHKKDRSPGEEACITNYQ